MRVGSCLAEVNFGVDRLGSPILGANGQGKTTLLNLIMGRSAPEEQVVINNGLESAALQHSSDNFDLKRSAIENMLSKFGGHWRIKR
jgi:ATPase subunit of ABC transporter with duplicated ATPase domains